MPVVEHDHADFLLRYMEFGDDVGNAGAGRIIPRHRIKAANAEGGEKFYGDLHGFS
jgi:hypothetical protein